jgi:exodeoxyribonuclease VII large subunit
VAELKATINRSQKTVTFSGGGTFHAKDSIKSLGNVSWRPETKSWVLISSDISEAQLQELFPEVQISHEGAEIESPANSLSRPTEAKQDPSTDVPDGMSVAMLIGRTRAVLRKAFPQTVFVKGVLSKVNRSRHMYLELTDLDDNSVHITCFIWDREIGKVLGEVEKAGFKLEADLEVMFEVRVDVNPRRANISLTVERVVVEYLIGKLAAERDKTNERLKKDGLFARNKELSLPLLPKRLGVITSSGGTVINDFMSSIEQGQFGFQLFWYPAAVQGSDAVNQVLQGIKVLENYSNLDAILIFRGGGSKSELSVFNNYEVAKAVCLCSLPVISAIGHQEDQSSVQDVSFQALGVPKDIGRYFADIAMGIRERLLDYVGTTSAYVEEVVVGADREVGHLAELISSRLEITLEHRFEQLNRMRVTLPVYCRNFLNQCEQRLNDVGRPLPSMASTLMLRAVSSLTGLIKEMRYHGVTLVKDKEQKLRLAKEITNLAQHQTEKLALRINNFEQLIEALKPENQLKLGFTLIKDKSGEHYLTSGKRLSPEDEIQIEFYDTIRDAIITK